MQSINNNLSPPTVGMNSKLIVFGYVLCRCLPQVQLPLTSNVVFLTLRTPVKIVCCPIWATFPLNSESKLQHELLLINYPCVFVIRTFFRWELLSRLIVLNYRQRRNWKRMSYLKPWIELRLFSYCLINLKRVYNLNYPKVQPVTSFLTLY